MSTSWAAGESPEGIFGWRVQGDAKEDSASREEIVADSVREPFEGCAVVGAHLPAVGLDFPSRFGINEPEGPFERKLNFFCGENLGRADGALSGAKGGQGATCLGIEVQEIR